MSVKLSLEDYCQECNEFVSDTKCYDSSGNFSIEENRVIVKCNYTVTCKNISKCSAMARNVKKLLSSVKSDKRREI